MTDYSGLIARVRSPYALTERDAQEIADALEAQAKEIAELNEEVNCWAEASAWPEHSPRQLRARIVELEKREKHLEEMFHGWRDEAIKASARIAELEAEAEFAEKELLHTLKVKNEGDARIMELEAALGKAAKRLKQIQSSPRISRSQYKIYAEEAFAALNGEK